MSTIKLLTFLSILLITFCLLTFQSYSAEENPCVACHVDLKQPSKSVHAVLKMGCSACHKSVEGNSHPDQKGSIILTQKMPGLCYGCHEESKYKGTSGHTRLGMCTGCHNPHRSDAKKLLLSDQPDLCYACHDKAKFTKKNVHGIINVGGCTSCHAPHISDQPFLLSSPEHELCISCHAAKTQGSHVVALPGRKRHPVIGVKDPSTLKMIKVPDPKNPQKQIEVPDPNVPGKDMNCSSCHDPHSSDFKALLTAEKICMKCHKF
jgi:predicted CXXCH cytochrome family protein